MKITVFVCLLLLGGVYLACPDDPQPPGGGEGTAGPTAPAKPSK